MAVVSKLEDDNRRLREQLTRNNDLNPKSEQSNPTETVSITREELQCIKNLTEENIRFKRILKLKEKELTQKTFDMEAVSFFLIIDNILLCKLFFFRFKLNLNVYVN